VKTSRSVARAAVKKAPTGIVGFDEMTDGGLPSGCTTLRTQAQGQAMRGRPHYKFRLYIAGDSGNSALAVQNINSICRTHLPGRYEIEHVDVFREPQRALADLVVMTPTLIRLAPLPMCRIVGTLSETKNVLSILGLNSAAA
jgi:circadian clock protein KaiB